MSKRHIKIQEQENEFSLYIVEKWLRHLVLNLFEYDNLPDEIETYYIEQSLYNHGKVLFFNDDNLGYFALPISEQGELNEYNEMTEYRIITKNGTKFDNYNKYNSVLIKNNNECQTSIEIVRYYANKLANIMRTIDININTLKTPYIFRGSKNELLTLENIFNQISGNALVTFIDKSLSEKFLEIMELKNSYVGDKLIDVYNNILNMFLTHFGIDNTNIDKKERLIVDEVNSNNELITLSGGQFLWERKKAVKKINEMYGLNIEVNYNKLIKGDNKNVAIHNDD